MELLIIFFILFIISVALTYLLGYKIEQTIAITCFSIIILLYIFGLAGIMFAGTYVVIAASVAALGFCVWGIIKRSIDRSYLFENIFTPGFVFFCVFYLFICYVHIGRVLTFWDEFSHWGLVVKNMYIFDAFGNHPDATTLFRGYPPSTSLFMYFWMQFNGFYEPHLYRAFGVLSFSFLLPVFKNVGWRNFKVAPFIALFLVMVPVYLYYDYYREIYVDGIMGILFTYILFAYFTEKEFNTAFYINIAMATFVLTLVKASGFGLALTAAIIIILDYIITARRLKKENRLGDNVEAETKSDEEHSRTIGNRIKELLMSKPFCVSAVALVTPVIANQSWSIYRQFTDTEFAWGGVSNFTVSAVMEFITGRADGVKYAITENYILTFLHHTLYVGETGFAYSRWTLIFALVLFLWFRKTEKPLRNKLISCAVGVLTGWIIYNVSLLLLYVFTFPEDVAGILASLGRYLNTYFLAAICLFSLLYFYYVNENDKLGDKKKLIRMVVFLVVALANFYFHPVLNLMRTPDPGARKEVTIGRLAPLELDYRTDRVHYIFQHSSGFHHFVAYFELTPVKGAEWLHWSIGTPYGEEDVWTTFITLDEWLEMLRDGYTYVYLEHINEQFIDEFGGAFENNEQIKNRSLFRVTERNNNIVLVYVDLEVAQ